MNVRTLAVLVTAATLLAGLDPTDAQEPSANTGRVTVTTLPHPQPDALAPQCTPPSPGAAVPVLPACAPFEDCNGPLLKGDPLLDRRDCATPGWVLAAELGIVKPRITGFLAGQVNVGNVFTDTIALPAPFYQWTGAPRLELGYRFPEAFGEAVLSYRLLVSDGCATLDDLNGTGPADMHGHLDLHSIDLDYAQHEHFLGPHCDLKWRVGARLASIFYDTEAATIFDAQRASDHFVGAGPHAGLDLRWSPGGPRWSLYSRVEGAALWGRIHQNFDETVTIPGMAPFGGAVGSSHTQAVPVIDVQAGLAWVPWKTWPLRLEAGYQYEIWWNIARTPDSTGDLYDQGAFLRAEWNY